MLLAIIYWPMIYSNSILFFHTGKGFNNTNEKYNINDMLYDAMRNGQITN